MAYGLEQLLALEGNIQVMIAQRDGEEARRAEQANEMEERKREIMELIEQLERDIAALPPTPENEAELRRLTAFVEQQRRSLEMPSKWIQYAKYAAVGTAAGGAIAATGGVALLGLVGFGSGGVIGGTAAATIQSIFYGAWTTGVFSMCQSAAATGVIGAAGMASGAGVGAAVGAAAAKATAWKIMDIIKLVPTQKVYDLYPPKCSFVDFFGNPTFEWEMHILIEKRLSFFRIILVVKYIGIWFFFSESITVQLALHDMLQILVKGARVRRNFYLISHNLAPANRPQKMVHKLFRVLTIDKNHTPLWFAFDLNHQCWIITILPS